MTKPHTIGAFCELRIYSAARIEIYDAHIVEIIGAAYVRVKLAHNGQILRVFSGWVKVY